MQSRALIERTYDREDIQQNHNIRNYAIRVKGGRKEIRQMRKSASHSSLLNLTVTTAEGIALGALGIGMPDIILFLSTLLKFIQGLPIVGIIGGVANPFYYNKVMRYVQLKYNKRYLLQLCTRSILCTD